MQLQTARLILRSFREEDVDAMAQLFAQSGFHALLVRRFHRTQTDGCFHRESDGLGSREHAVAVCRCLAWRTTLSLVTAVFSITLKCQERSRSGTDCIPITGIAASSLKPRALVRDHGFGDLKLPRVISLIHPENIPSRRVAEKNGMKVEKEITFRGFPTLVYSITREEWLAKRGAS